MDVVIAVSVCKALGLRGYERYCLLLVRGMYLGTIFCRWEDFLLKNIRDYEHLFMRSALGVTCHSSQPHMNERGS